MRIRTILILLSILLVLGGVYFAFAMRPKEETVKPRVYVWDVSDNDIQHIVISLPREGNSQSFIKISQGDKFPWYFDDKEKTPVDQNRWGGGIALLLSGPGADRIITEDASPDQLETYGLTNPSMKITLSLVTKEVLEIDVGDATPNGENYYVRSPYSNAVATVDKSWYEVLAALVTNPPYITTTTSTTGINQ